MVQGRHTLRSISDPVYPLGKEASPRHGTSQCSVRLLSLTCMPQVILLLVPQNLPSLGRRPSILASPELSFCTNRVRNSGGNSSPCSLDFLSEVGRRLSAATGDARQKAFLFHRTSISTFQP